MTDSDGSEDGWFRARKQPVAVDVRGPYTDPDTVETLEGDFEVDEDYVDEHGGYYIIRGVRGETYPCGADIFEATYKRVEEDAKTPILHCSDGPRLILADGSVVCPRVSFDMWDKMMFLHRDQGASVYGPEADDPRVAVAFVDDANAQEVAGVSDRLEAYGFSED